MDSEMDVLFHGSEKGLRIAFELSLHGLYAAPTINFTHSSKKHPNVQQERF
jgi:hypothetical protein